MVGRLEDLGFFRRSIILTESMSAINSTLSFCLFVCFDFKHDRSDHYGSSCIHAPVKKTSLSGSIVCGRGGPVGCPAGESKWKSSPNEIRYKSGTIVVGSSKEIVAICCSRIGILNERTESTEG